MSTVYDLGSEVPSGNGLRIGDRVVVPDDTRGMTTTHAELHPGDVAYVYCYWGDAGGDLYHRGVGLCAVRPLGRGEDSVDQYIGAFPTASVRPVRPIRKKPPKFKTVEEADAWMSTWGRTSIETSARTSMPG